MWYGRLALYSHGQDGRATSAWKATIKQQLPLRTVFVYLSARKDDGKVTREPAREAIAQALEGMGVLVQTLSPPSTISNKK